MATREEYTTCMTPYMTGTKTKKERQHDMCVGAKICSGKAQTREEAEKICSVPKLPKWAKKALPADEKPVSCEDRVARVVVNIEEVSQKVKTGAAAEAAGNAAQLLNDIYQCVPDPTVVEMLDDAMEGFGQMTKGFYFKGEGKDLANKLNLVKEIIT